MAWADTAERLKHELTDKYVVVMDGVPELRRFAGRTGTVKTVNMSGRALVQFEAPADISWYDIDPTYLTVIDAPLPKKASAAVAEKPAAEGKPAPKAAAKAKGGLSPLELARQQGAGGAQPAATGAKKLSPLEMARQQGAAAASGAKPAATPAAGKKLSPLELARQQGAAKAGGTSPEAAQAVTPAAPLPAAEVNAEPPAEAAPAEPAVEKPAAAAHPAGMSKLELARRQGPFKG